MASAAAGFDPEKGPQLLQDSDPSLSTSSSEEEEEDDENREYSYPRPQDHPSLMCPSDDEEFEKLQASRRRKKPVRIRLIMVNLSLFFNKLQTHFDKYLS
jgi:hypothetical protein